MSQVARAGTVSLSSASTTGIARAMCADSTSVKRRALQVVALADIVASIPLASASRTTVRAQTRTLTSTIFVAAPRASMAHATRRSVVRSTGAPRTTCALLSNANSRQTVSTRQSACVVASRIATVEVGVTEGYADLAATSIASVPPGSLVAAHVVVRIAFSIPIAEDQKGVVSSIPMEIVFARTGSAC